MKCKNCGREFEPHHGNQKHCSEKCRKQYAAHRYYLQQREKILAAYHANSEPFKEKYRRYYREHCEEIKQKRKIYRMTGVWRRGRLTT